MIHRNVELHNVAELRPDGDGVALQRVPESVRKCLNPHAQERMLDSTCMEIRFVIEEQPAAVRLRSPSNAAQAHVFFGEFQTGQTLALGAAPAGMAIHAPGEWFLRIERAKMGRTAFAHRVCRVCLSGGQVCFEGVEGKVRPPAPGEVPSLRYLAYGTSITQGAGSTLRHLCYAAQAARRLGADLINLGVGSSAFCEPELADYVAAREDWDLATLEPTANMQHFALEEYEARLDYWVRVLLAGPRPRPVVCITLLPQAADLGPEHLGRRHKATPEQYRDAMRRIAAARAHPLLHLVEGPDLLPDIGGLGPDLLHPKDNGHIVIGENLAKALQEIRENVAPAAGHWGPGSRV
jgi:lysophospholipase L1-like esterase